LARVSFRACARPYSGTLRRGHGPKFCDFSNFYKEQPPPRGTIADQHPSSRGTTANQHPSSRGAAAKV